jgi:hypothetical protein
MVMVVKTLQLKIQQTHTHNNGIDRVMAQTPQIDNEVMTMYNLMETIVDLVAIGTNLLMETEKAVEGDMVGEGMRTHDRMETLEETLESIMEILKGGIVEILEEDIMETPEVVDMETGEGTLKQEGDMEVQGEEGGIVVGEGKGVDAEALWNSTPRWSQWIGNKWN